MSSGFETFIGIDWSGAKGDRHKGIAVACVGADRVARLLKPKNRRVWSRQSVLDMLAGSDLTRTLVGMDFAFSLPWPDEGPLPPGSNQPASARALWRQIEQACVAEADLYAGPVYRDEGGLLADYVLLGNIRRGKAYDGSRRRLTEATVRPGPNSVFKIVGANTVGPGSFAGMRLLCALKQQRGDAVRIWPFEPVARDHLTVVEIYPSAFFRMAGHRRTADGAKLSDVFRHFGVSGPANRPDLTQDEADALVSAAALHHLGSQDGALGAPPGDRVRREGWIFGVSTLVPDGIAG